ncbi:MAG: EAL domain-containing protein [Betaproteobacteria bacterium]|nr:EAL domain-containing protein [Betaproteobacteria bacterium]
MSAGDRPAGSRTHGSPETIIWAEQIRGLYSRSAFGALASALAASVLCAVLWPVSRPGLLVIWLASLSVLLLSRLVLARVFRRLQPAEDQISAWGYAFIALSTLTAACWGTAGSLLLPGDELHQVFVGFVIAGIAAGAISTLAGSTLVYTAFLLPLVTPFIVTIWRIGDGIHEAMAALGVTFGLVMILVSERLSRSIRQTVELRIRNSALVEELSRSKSELESAYSALQVEVAERRVTQQVLSKSEERLRLHAEQAPLAFVEWDLGFRVTDWNPAAERIFGYARADVLGRTASDLIACPDTCDEVASSWHRMLKDRAAGVMTMTNRTRSGARVICDWHYAPLVDASGRVASLLTFAVDVTNSRLIEERLEYLAYHDTVTGLPNRSAFRDRLAAAVEVAATSDEPVSVLLFDLDHFKVINETMGHELGDRLLALVGQRLSERLPGDAFLSRFGGDEFGVVLRAPPGASAVTEVAQGILDCFLSALVVEGREVFLAASIGIAVYPADSTDVDGLLKCADSAMYQAKRQGRNTFQFYSADLTRRSVTRVAVENGLRRAIERDELVLYYHPLIDVVSGAVTGVEALLRWRHPERGLVPPLQFIPVAEDSGLIVPIGEWVLRRACTELREWGRQGGPSLRLSVNLSPRQFGSERLVAAVVQILGETGFDPSRLELEITESVLMDESGRVRTALQQFKGMGITIAIDDFGTGYSSLGYLKHLPVDVLKVDRSFVRDVPADLDDVAIVRAVIGMARNLRLRTVAEGVESQEQLMFLRSEGCDEVQGFLFGEPAEGPEALRRIMLRAKLARL